jgi:integrase
MASIRRRKWQSGGQERLAWIADYFDQHGKRHIKTFATKRDAEAALIEVMHEVGRGTHTAPSTSATIAEAASAWIEEGHRHKLERSTMMAREAHVRHHIVPMIGKVKLSDLTTPLVDHFASQLRDRPYGGDASRTISLATAKKILASVKAILRHAQRTGSISKNPAEPVSVKVPTRGTKKIRAGRDFPTKDEVRDILKTVEGRWRPLIVTAALTGMRSSELRALTWENVDFDAGLIRVRQRADAWNVLGAPKSEAGERDIPLMPTVTRTLKEWRLKCPRLPVDGNPAGSLWLAFPNGHGHIESHSNIVNRGFLPLQVRAGVAEKIGVDPDGNPIFRARYGLHTLRHFFATYMIERGVAPKRLQGMLGHSSLVMTMDTYGHLFENLESDQALMAAADTALVG